MPSPIRSNNIISIKYQALFIPKVTLCFEKKLWILEKTGVHGYEEHIYLYMCISFAYGLDQFRRYVLPLGVSDRCFHLRRFATGRVADHSDGVEMERSW